jgi:hypothetical protein
VIRRAIHRRVVTAVLGAAALAAAGLLTACGTGQIAETADIVPAVPGANLNLNINGGLLSVRDATVDYPGPQGYQPGDDAPLTIRIINGTTSPVTLTGAVATTPAGATIGGKVLQVGGVPSAAPSAESPVPATRAPTPTPATSGRGRSAKPSVSPSASPTASGSASQSASTGPVGSPNINVPVPAAPDGLIILSKANSGGSYLAISGLTQALRPGKSVRLVLTFTLADGSTVQMGASTVPSQQLVVPVAVPASPLPRSPLSLSPAGG